MIEQTIDIDTRAGTMETFVCHPERHGPHPVILFLMDAPGVREELHDMVRRLAATGYYVLLPNLYYRAGRDTKFGPDVLTEGSDDHRAMRAIRTKMTIPPVMEDVADLFAYTARQSAASDGPAGCHGYCMSGPYALAAAARYPERIAAAASFIVTRSSLPSPPSSVTGMRSMKQIGHLAFGSSSRTDGCIEHVYTCGWPAGASAPA